MKLIIRKIIALLIVDMSICAVNAQTYHQISLGFNGSKDGVNNGILFNGVQLGYKFGVRKSINNSLLDYSVAIDVGALKGKGIWDVDLNIKPINLSYGLPLYKQGNSHLLIGPKLEADYRLQLYPNLQMGNLMWITNYALYPQMTYIHKLLNGDAIRFSADYALVSLASRTEHIDPYFFSLRFVDIISNLHSNMRIVFPDKLTKVNAGVEYLFGKAKRDYAIGYEFNYLGYDKTHHYKELSHMITFKMLRK